MDARLFLLLALALAGCGSASASNYDSRDPVHCAGIFSMTAVGAMQRSHGALADEMNGRLIYLTKSRGGADWLNGARPEGARLAQRWEAEMNGPALIRLLEECRAQQNSDPAYHAALPEVRALAKRVGK